MSKESEIKIKRYDCLKSTKYFYMKDADKTNQKAAELGARKPYAVCNK